MIMTHRPNHFVAIVGGAIAGSVAAEILADNGIHVVVIEQNKKPYGKIEDGLPRWHLEQRKQEHSRIDARLRKPGVFFLPSTRLGRDIDFQDLCDKWGFSAVILANGAWRDRELGIPGAEEFVDKGLVYQNPFIYWYADIVRIHNGALVEHWDVIQGEKTEEQSISKRPMFGTIFPTYA
jgi:ferredoxin/flavodoxin---NADP+ reductase